MLHRHVFSDTALTFPEDLPASRAVAGTAATSEAVFSILLNAVVVGTITFGAAQDEGVFATDDDISVEARDILEVVAPSPADATLADISITIAGGVGAGIPLRHRM